MKFGGKDDFGDFVRLFEFKLAKGDEIVRIISAGEHIYVGTKHKRVFKSTEVPLRHLDFFEITDRFRNKL